MILTIRNLSAGLRTLHEDEDGMEAIQVVALVAIAAIVLVYLKGPIWNRVQSFVNQKLQELISGH